MSPSRVSISPKHARAIVSEDPHPLLDEALESIRQQLAPKKKNPLKSFETRKQVRASKKKTKREETSAIYDEVAERADGACELCDEAFSELDPPEFDHARGRSRARQSAKNTWLIHRGCHRAKHNGPAEEWLVEYRAHAHNHRFWDEERWADRRLAYVRARAALETK